MSEPRPRTLALPRPGAPPVPSVPRPIRRTLANGLRVRAQRIYSLPDGVYQLEASIGIAIFPADGDTAETLLAHADRAMYAAKRAGLSYKAAWDAIDELNNLADQPLVERSVGGRGGSRASVMTGRSGDGRVGRRAGRRRPGRERPGRQTGLSSERPR